MHYSSCKCALKLDFIENEEQLDSILRQVAKQARQEIQASLLRESCENYQAEHDDPVVFNSKHPFGSITSDWDLLYDEYIVSDKEEMDITQAFDTFRECTSKVVTNDHGIEVVLENEVFDNGDCKEIVFAVASVLFQYSSKDHFKVFSSSINDQGVYPHLWIGYQTNSGVAIEHEMECLERLTSEGHKPDL